VSFRCAFVSPAAYLALDWPRRGIALEEVDHQCIGQRLGVELLCLVLGVDSGLQHQRDVVEEGIADW